MLQVDNGDETSKTDENNVFVDDVTNGKNGGRVYECGGVNPKTAGAHYTIRNDDHIGTDCGGRPCHTHTAKRFYIFR